MICRSVPQIVVFVILTMASVGAVIMGMGLSSKASLPGPWYTSAFMIILRLEIVLSMRSQEAQFGAQLFYLFEQAKQSLEQRYVSAVIDPNMLDTPYGMNSLFSEGHDSIRWLKGRPHKTGTTVDQYGTARNTR
jgi:hypothetical protein